MPTTKIAPKRFLTAAQLQERWGGCSHMFIERRLAGDPRFPRPVKLGGRLRFFPLDEIEEYERACVVDTASDAA